MPAPKHKFYRSKANGLVHAAMSSPEGYEDQHPEDWEPATREEFNTQHRRSLPPIEAEATTVAPPVAPPAQAIPQFGAPAVPQFGAPAVPQFGAPVVSDGPVTSDDPPPLPPQFQN